MEGPQASIGEINPWLPPRTYLIDIHHWENQGLNVSCFTIKTTKKIVSIMGVVLGAAMIAIALLAIL